MNPLFVRLYLDEDVSVVLAHIVHARGYDVLTARMVNMLGRTDDEQLAFAASDGRAIVTHNRDDFQQLATQYLQQGKSHFGIIIAVRRPIAQTAQRLLKLLVRSPPMKCAIKYDTSEAAESGIADQSRGRMSRGSDTSPRDHRPASASTAAMTSAPPPTAAPNAGKSLRQREESS